MRIDGEQETEGAADAMDVCGWLISLALISRRNSAVSKMTPILGDFNEPPSTYRDAACACPRFEALADETINREWAGPANNEGCEAGDIEQVDLITYRSEFRARRRHREELDRAEPIRQVHFKHGHQ